MYFDVEDSTSECTIETRDLSFEILMAASYKALFLYVNGNGTFAGSRVQGITNTFTMKTWVVKVVELVEMERLKVLMKEKTLRFFIFTWKPFLDFERN